MTMNEVRCPKCHSDDFEIFDTDSSLLNQSIEKHMAVCQNCNTQFQILCKTTVEAVYETQSSH